MDFKSLAGGAVLAATAALLTHTPASAAPATAVTALARSSGTAATNVEWRYHYRHGHRERYWYGPRVIRRILRAL